MSKIEKKIAVFVCNWDGLSSMEAASRLGYCLPSSVKIIKVGCLSRIHLGLILRAFELGADGVMLMGCEPGNCHFDTDSGLILKELEKAQNILNLLGLESDRLLLLNITYNDGYGFVKKIADFKETIGQLRALAPV